jgi:preprotein translocase subunit YajC
MEMFPLILMLGVIYFMLWRPQIKEQEAHRALLESLAKDDRVVTMSGIHGRVIKVSDETVSLDVAKGTQIIIDKASVQRRVDDASKK